MFFLGETIATFFWDHPRGPFGRQLHHIVAIYPTPCGPDIPPIENTSAKTPKVFKVRLQRRSPASSFSTSTSSQHLSLERGHSRAWGDPRQWLQWLQSLLLPWLDAQPFDTRLGFLSMSFNLTFLGESQDHRVSLFLTLRQHFKIKWKPDRAANHWCPVVTSLVVNIYSMWADYYLSWLWSPFHSGNTSTCLLLPTLR